MSESYADNVTQMIDKPIVPLEQTHLLLSPPSKNSKAEELSTAQSPMETPSCRRLPELQGSTCMQYLEEQLGVSILTISSQAENHSA